LTVLGERFFHHRRDAFRIADVDLQGQGVAFVGIDLRRDFFRALFGEVGDDHVQAVGRQAAADFRTDAAGTAGDKNRFAHDASPILLVLPGLL